MSAIAAAVAALIVATGPLGDGGRVPIALLLHHSALALALIAILRLAPREIARAAWPWLAVAGFSLFALAVSPYAYAARLRLADILATTALWFLASLGAREASGRRWLLAGLAVAGLLCLLAGGAEWLRGEPVHGLFSNPHWAGGLVAAVASAWSARLLAANSSSVAGRLLPAVPLLGAGVFAGLLASRGTLLALAAGGTVALAVNRRLRLLGVLALVGAILLLAVPNRLGRRLLPGGEHDIYSHERVRIWRLAAGLAAEHGWRGGVGLGGFEAAARARNFPVDAARVRYAKVANIAHNEYVELLVEAGPPGLALLLVPLGLIGWRRLRPGEDGSRSESGVVLAGLAALAAHALVDGVLHAPANLYLFAVLLGLGSARARPPSPAPPGAILRLGLAVAVAWAWASLVWIPWAADRAMASALVDGDAAALARALRLEPGHAGYLTVAGRAKAERAFRSGSIAQLEEARWLLAEAARRDPANGRRWATLAGFEQHAASELLPFADLVASALGHYDRAIQLEPFNVLLGRDRARFLASLGRGDEAVRELERAVAIEPNFRDGWSDLLRLALERGDAAGAAQARRELDRVVALGKSLAPGGSYEAEVLGIDPGSHAVARPGP